MRWASAIATPSRLEDAIDEAADTVLAELGQEPDLVVAFVSATYSDHYGSLPAALRARFPHAVTFGCCAGGVIGNRTEVESQDAVALVAAVLPGVEIATFRLGDEPDNWPNEMAIDPDLEPELIILTDPFSCDASKLVPWLDAAFPSSTKIGGIASGATAAGESILLLGDELYRTGAIGLALTGNIEIDTIVAQGCKPVGSPMFITRAAGPVLYELDGQSAMLTLEKLFATLGEDDRSLARNSLFLGIVMVDQQEVYEHGDFLIRNIVGIDPEALAVAVSAELREGSIAQFHLRDAHTSTSDLQELLAKHQYGSPAGALLFTCMGRGQDLYGSSNHDTDLFHNQMGQVPMGGFFSNGEIGPVLGQTFLHSYTSAFGLFRPKHVSKVEPSS
jgi:small ligand-binding sensory domain FIST